VPNGTAWIETRLPLLFDRGVRGGRLSMARMVATLAETPARVFGLYPRKGTLAPGSDADVVLFDPDGTTTISAASHHSAIDHSVYEGWQLQGSVDTVLVRGRTVVDEGALVVDPGHGRFLHRPALPVAVGG
jgi:dihydropyrimidinase